MKTIIITGEREKAEAEAITAAVARTRSIAADEGGETCMYVQIE